MGVALETDVVEEMGVALEEGSAAGGRRAAVGGRDRVLIDLLRSLSGSGGRGLHGFALERENRTPKKSLLQRKLWSAWALALERGMLSRWALCWWRMLLSRWASRLGRDHGRTGGGRLDGSVS